MSSGSPGAPARLSLGVWRPKGIRPAFSPTQLAAISGSALDRPLKHDAELLVAEPAGTAVVLGAMQRQSEIGSVLETSERLVRRGSGGAEARVGPGSLWFQLALARSDALVECEPGRLANRYVRPLLRALAKVGALSHYFDRDWISASKRPIGMIAFAHDATTGRALVEVIIAVSAPFALRERASYLGKAPTTLAGCGANVTVERLADAIVDAYATSYGCTVVALDADELANAPRVASDPSDPSDPSDLQLDPPWTATREEAIGTIGAGRDRKGRMRIGGELMASRDAVARVEVRLAELEGVGLGAPDADLIGRVLDDSLHARGVALTGLRSLASLRDLLVEAFAAVERPQ